MSEKTTSIRMPFLAASLLSIIWLAIVAWVFLHDDSLPAQLPQLLALAATAFAPVAAGYALAAALGQVGADAGERHDSPESGDGQLQDAEARIGALRAALRAEAEGLQAVNETLALQSKSIATAVGKFGKASVQAMEAGQQLDSLLSKTTEAAAGLRQLLEATASSAAAEGEKTNAAALGLAEALAQLAQQGKTAAEMLAEARTASEAGTRAIRGEADTLFETLENTHVARRNALTKQGEAMAQQLQSAYARLEALATAAGGRLAQQLEAVDRQAGSIEGRLQANSMLTETLLTSGERTFQLLDARLAHSSETSAGALDRLSARVQEVGRQLEQLTAPIRDTGQASGELEQTVAALKETALQLVDLLGKTVPEQVGEAGRATLAVAADVDSLLQGIRRAHEAAETIREPLSGQRQLLDEASALCAGQRRDSEAAAAALVAELQQARLILHEVETAIEGSSLRSASGLVDTMANLREVVSQTGGSIREALDDTIAQAKESLSAAAADAMRKSFAEPIARHARQAEETAARAAERTASSMAALADVLKLLESQVEERTAHLEAARQADLLASANLLTDRLAEASVSISSALGRPMDDDDWAKWRNGERGLFHLRALRLLDRREAKELQDLLESDGDFATAARDYSAGFEALLQRTGKLAPGLAAALQESEQGRLAAALSEALAS